MRLRFEACEGWGVLPDGWRFVEVAGVATDSRDRVFVFNRGDHPVIIFDREGRFVGSWGEGLFVRPHGITIGPDDAVYCTDDLDHTVKKFTPTGTLLGILGKSGSPSDTGATSMDFRTIRHAGPPFHYPTNLALAADGSLYISDGYGNSRVHLFSSDFDHLTSWGEPGGGPGEFRLPHGIAVGPDGTVVVADRENSRLQFFSPEGRFLEEWTDIARPCQVRGRRPRARVRRRAGLPCGDVAGDDRALPGRDRRTGQRLRPRRPAARPLGWRIEPLCTRATSSRPTTSASIRGATSTSAR